MKTTRFFRLTALQELRRPARGVRSRGRGSARGDVSARRKALGWNFGDGQLHSEQLLRAAQAQCGFDEGELRCIMVEAQPLFGATLHYRIHDAKRGLLEQGHSEVSRLRTLQPGAKRPECKHVARRRLHDGRDSLRLRRAGLCAGVQQRGLVSVVLRLQPADHRFDHLRELGLRGDPTGLGAQLVRETHQRAAPRE